MVLFGGVALAGFGLQAKGALEKIVSLTDAQKCLGMKAVSSVQIQSMYDYW